MPWCPECGGLSGPRTRWKFVVNQVRRPRVIATAALVAIGFVIASTAGPGMTWAARTGVISGGAMLWLCEAAGGADPRMLDSACDQDAAAALNGRDRQRLAKLILANNAAAPKRITASQERALTRFAAAGVLTAEQSSAYAWLVLGQSGQAPVVSAVVSSPTSPDGRTERAVRADAKWLAPSGVNVYDVLGAANLSGSQKLDVSLPPGYVSMPSTLSPPRTSTAEKPKKAAETEKKEKDKEPKVTW